MKQKRYRFLVAFLTLSLALGLIAIPTASAANAAGTAVGAWGVDEALAPAGDWRQLDTGQEQWYAFNYAGDGSQIQMRLEVTPQGSAGFVVWTPEEIQGWASGKHVTPIGRGSDDPLSAGNLIWSGSFTTAGTYYVVVEHSGNSVGTSHYRLSVEGDGISTAISAQVDTPASTVAATSESTSSQPRSALVSELSGTLVFQTTYGGPFYTIDVDGTDLQRITNGIDPVWSPNGGQIAFVRWEEPRGVWVIDVGTGNEYRVFDWSETRHPSWSPDGELVFSRQHGTVANGGAGRPPGPGGRRGGGPPGGAGPGGGAGGTWQLGIVDPGDGSFREPLPNSDTNLTPDWSPDGEQIVFAGQHGLMVQSADGQEAWQLTSDPKDASPVWSPDGEQVAFVHRQHDHWEIYIVDVATGQQTRLTDTLALANDAVANSVSPAWSPDGNSLAFLTDRAEGRAGEWEIWVMAADGSDPGPLFSAELDGLTLDYAFGGERAIDWMD